MNQNNDSPHQIGSCRAAASLAAILSSELLNKFTALAGMIEDSFVALFVRSVSSRMACCPLRMTSVSSAEALRLHYGLTHGAMQRIENPMTRSQSNIGQQAVAIGITFGADQVFRSPHSLRVHRKSELMDEPESCSADRL